MYCTKKLPLYKLTNRDRRNTSEHPSLKYRPLVIGDSSSRLKESSRTVPSFATVHTF